VTKFKAVTVGASKKTEAVQLEEYAVTLEKSDDYRVLRRLGDLVPAVTQGELLNGLYLDVESTGLNVDKDEVIELGMIPFGFSRDGLIGRIDAPFHAYHQPTNPIPEKISKINGISNEMVAGARIPVADVEAMVKASHLIVAHNAEYDRKMVERITGTFEKVCWGCSMIQVPWGDFDITGRKLEYVLAGLGRFYKAHNAVNDCQAGVFALQATLPSGKTALAHVLEAGRVPGYHVWALNAPYDAKDALKARGYFWNPGEDGRAKAWHKEVLDDDAEQEWLARNVYKNLVDGGRHDRITAFERFSKRG